ncbi:hypothetical protein HOY80DRAFT_1031550 [Tuber brumale]|nr:hypothetical protein HOY80DRAFT_1031550 [Tuber brumale]
MSSPLNSENMGPPTPTPRQRRYSGDSEQSKESWQNLIHNIGSYAGSPMQHFLTEEQRLDRIVIPNTPLGRTNFPPPSSSHPSDISVAEADCGSSTTHQSDRMTRSEGSTYTTSSMPTLDSSSLTSLSSPTPSTSYHPQMYELQEDSSGGLYTYQPIRTAFRTVTRPNGTHPCLFSFNECPEAFDRADNWVAHVDSHFADQEIPPPSSCTCSVCGKLFSAYGPRLNWERFLKHTFDDHLRDGLIQEIAPHPDFVMHCRDASMISDFTCTRIEGHQLASFEDDRTPRSRRGPQRDTDIAQVHFPSTWELQEAQPRTATTIVVNRSGQARGGRSRTSGPRGTTNA